MLVVMIDPLTAVGLAQQTAGAVDKASGVLAKIADYWGLGRWLDRHSRSKDVKASLAEYESLYGREMPDVMKDVVWAKYLTESRRMDNLSEVIRLAGEARAEDTGDNSPATPQQDWLDTFEDGASHAYDDEVRAMWAQLLAGEINRPGTFSKRTLATLNNMSPLEAQRFRELCSWCFDVYCEGEPPYAVPLLAQVDGKGRTYGGFPLPRGTILEDAGLVTQSTGRKIVFQPGPNAIIVNGNVRQVWNSERHTVCFMSGYSLTSTGRELALLCAHGTAEDDIPRLISERFEDDMPTIGPWIVLNPPSGSSEAVPSTVQEAERAHLYR